MSRKTKTENVVNAPASASSQPTTERNPPLTHRQIMAGCLTDARFTLFTLADVAGFSDDALQANPAIATLPTITQAVNAVAKAIALQYGHETAPVMSAALADARFDNHCPKRIALAIVDCQSADKEWHKRDTSTQLAILALYFTFAAPTAQA